ncbi:MAG: 3-deoxy-D-manno-octulosonic acid transferase [Planctomycetia bacterium]|nr:3-deoxy-D-manno-octulosonic acid transferase [Planctomycetia bacterium]
MPLFAWLLNLIYLVLLPAIFLFRLVLRRKGIPGGRQKVFGLVPRRVGNRPCLWLHAVSVGEVLQLQPVLEALTHNRPDLELVISTTTPTGYDVARERYPGQTIFYFPLDFSWAVNAALSRINPTAIALVELELWPNFTFAAARQKIPLALINGRISEKSYRGYRWIFPLVQAMLRKIDVLAVQSDAYAHRLIDLGADPAAVYVTGSIKFDRVELGRTNPKTAELRQFFNLRDDETVFIAGSTQDPEERIALDSYLRLRAKYPRLRLILVPRHKERFDEVAQLVERDDKLPLIRRSASQKNSPRSPGVGTDRDVGPPGSTSAAQPPILLLDTLGELSLCWGLATIAFVGGSLTRRGGQNMIEPAGYGAAVLFGPNTWNFKDVVELLLSHGAALVVRSGEELTARLDELLADPARAAALGDCARKLVASQRGATARTVELLEDVLPDRPDTFAPRAA